VVTFSKPLSLAIQDNLISLYGKINNTYPEIMYDKVHMEKTPNGTC